MSTLLWAFIAGILNGLLEWALGSSPNEEPREHRPTVRERSRHPPDEGDDS